MGRVIPIRRGDSERLRREWLLIAERAAYVAEHSGDVVILAEMLHAYRKAKRDYLACVDGMGVSCG